MLIDKKEPASSGKESSKTMSETELKAILNSEIQNSMGYVGGELSEQRRRAMEYYLGEPFGNEIEGRSQVVSTDVADCVEWILPTLLKTFASTEEAVRFDPVGVEDAAAAEQETDYANYVFYKDNPGFLLLYTWFKDALLQKNGYVKAYWDESTKVTTETYEGLDGDQYLLLMQDDELEPVEHTEHIEIEEMPLPDGGVQSVEVKTHDVKFRRTKIEGRAKVVNVPPEEVGVSKTHNSIDIDTAPFSYHRTIKTVSELLEMGFDRKIVESLPSYEVNNNEEEVARNNLKDDERISDTNLDKSMRQVEVYECYIMVDYDKDGISELRKITKGGGATGEILENIECDSNALIALTPTILCHKHFGLSVADHIMDLQKIKSTIWRQLLDNMYLINNSRTAVNKNIVNLDDLLTSRPGGIVRVEGDPSMAITPIVTAPLGQTAFEMLGYIDQVREARTGVGQNTMGMGADLLNNNKGDASVQRLLSLAEQRVELIARIFAETGVKKLFLKIHELILKHQSKERIVQLRNNWVEVKPQEWQERTNMTITVGLGTGERQRLSSAMLALQNMQNTIAQGGGLGTLVTPKNIFNSSRDLMKYMGVSDINPYLTDPESPEGMKAAQEAKAAQQNGEGNMEAQLVKMQMQMQMQMSQLEQEKIALQHQREVFKLEQQNTKQQQDYLLQVEKLKSEKQKQIDDMAARLTEMELKYNTNVPGAVV